MPFRPLVDSQAASVRKYWHLGVRERCSECVLTWRAPPHRRNGEWNLDTPAGLHMIEADGSVMPLITLPANTVCSINLGNDPDWAFRYPPRTDAPATSNTLSTPEPAETATAIEEFAPVGQFGHALELLKPDVSAFGTSEPLASQMQIRCGNLMLSRTVLPPGMLCGGGSSCGSSTTPLCPPAAARWLKRTLSI